MAFNFRSRRLRRWLVALCGGLVAPAIAGTLGDALADNPARIAPAGIRLQAQASVDAFSDPAALLRLDDQDWGRHARSRHASNHAQLAGKAAVGVEAGGWRLQALTRSGGIARASADAVTLLGLLSRDEPPGSGEHFDLDYRLDFWRASGLSLGRGWRWAPAAGQLVEVGASLQVLTRIELLHETFSGTATPAGADRMLFDGQHRRAGNRMRTDDPSRFNPFVRDGNPRGHGRALDLGARWTLSERWQLELAGFDLAARLDGRDMPESLRVGRFLYDGEGRLIGNADGAAAVQGQDRRGDLRLRPQPRWLGRLGWQQQGWQVDLLAQSQAGVRQLELAGRRQLGDGGWWIGASMAARNTALGLSAGNAWFSVGLVLSHLRADQARALGAALRLNLPL
ncbi:hypothetical protein [Roseateles sp. LYH14W]|uniref:Alginate export domain-containing protein n=1 Tax=Pelomonas parva TaxID=3299032 RepID=A0ABW7F819_9BURK